MTDGVCSILAHSLYHLHTLNQRWKLSGGIMKKKRIFMVTAILLCLCMLTACTSATNTSKSTSAKADNQASDTKKNLSSVRLCEVAHSIFYAPMYVAIENGYFEDEGIELTLITGFGADKTMTAVISGEADIGFMGSEASIYTYNEGANDSVVNFAQLTQRAGNFLVAREEMTDFKWTDLKGKDVLGGRKGGVHISM